MTEPGISAQPAELAIGCIALALETQLGDRNFLLGLVGEAFDWRVHELDAEINRLLERSDDVSVQRLLGVLVAGKRRMQANA